MAGGLAIAGGAVAVVPPVVGVVCAVAWLVGGGVWIAGSAAPRAAVSRRLTMTGAVIANPALPIALASTVLWLPAALLALSGGAAAALTPLLQP